MRYERNSEVIYRNGFVATMTILIASVWVLGALGTVLTGGETAPILVLLGLTVLPLVTYGMLRPRVVLRESEVQIHGYVFEETVPYESITNALFTGEFLGYRWLEIHQTGGRTVGVLPHLSATVPFRDPLWQLPLAAEIVDRAKNASSAVGSDSSEQRPSRAGSSNRASSSSFSRPENWHGGFYELSVKLGPRSDSRLLETARWIWSRTDLDGPYELRDVEPADQEIVEITLSRLESGLLWGIAHIPKWAACICGSGMFRPEDGTDWFGLHVPMGALGVADTSVGGYPFDEASYAEAEWRSSLDDWLGEIAVSLYEVVPFEVGIIGFEVAGEEHLLTPKSQRRWPVAYVDSTGYHHTQW